MWVQLLRIWCSESSSAIGKYNNSLAARLVFAERSSHKCTLGRLMPGIGNIYSENNGQRKARLEHSCLINPEQFNRYQIPVH